jgi:hypothetical protein
MTFQVQTNSEQHTISDYKHAQIKFMYMVLNDFAMCDTEKDIDDTLDFILSRLTLTSFIVQAAQDYKELRRQDLEKAD